MADPVSKIVDAARASLFASITTDSSKSFAAGGDSIVPSKVRGKLAEAALRAAEAVQPAATSDDEMPFALGSITVRPPSTAAPGATVRTGAGLVHDVSGELRAAKTRGEVREGLRLMVNRLHGTGVYRDIQCFLEGAADKSAMDLIVEVDEARVSVDTGVTQSTSGKTEAGTQMRVYNMLGAGETLSASWATRGEISLTSGGLLDPSKASLSTFAERAAAAVSPSMSLALNKPTFMGRLTPVSLGLRSELEQHVWESGFSNQVAELTAGIKDEAGKHALTYAFALRNVKPLKAPNSVWDMAVCPEVIAEAGPSVKSSLTYSYLRDKQGHVHPASGTRTRFSLEAAGLGGDASWLKLSTAWRGAASAGRYSAETGYAPVPCKNDWVAAGNAAPKSSGLAAHPFFAQTAGQPWSWRHQWAGWAASGLTLLAEGEAAAVAPYSALLVGPLAGLASSAPAAAASPSIIDRVAFGSNGVRGYDALGPKGHPAAHGNPIGDMLGGQVLLGASLRALLPPPLPSVRLAGAGLRTQVWATAALVEPTLASAAATVAAGAPALASRASCAAGVGLTLPIGGAVAVEANWSMWHSGPASDARARFKVQIMA